MFAHRQRYRKGVERNTSQNKVLMYEILKSRFSKCLHTDKGIGKLLKKYKSEKSVEFV